MVKFQLVFENELKEKIIEEKDVFRLVTSVGKRENSVSI